MKTPSLPSDYSFEHGIDHCGYDGVAPILCIGGPVVAQDFVERDLTIIRGVSISQHGLSKGTKWQHLNLPFLFEVLPKIEYLRLYFDDPINLDDLGRQSRLQRLSIDCPKARGSLIGEMPLLRTAQVRWPDECTASMAAPGIEQLSLNRPRMSDLSPVSHLKSLRELDLWNARNFHSLQGLARLTSLKHLGLHNCPSLTDLDSLEPQDGLRELTIGGCLRFADASAVSGLTALRALRIYAGEKSPHEIRVPQIIKSQPIELDLRGVTPVWV